MENNRPIVLAQVKDETWELPRSVDSYKLIYSQACKACRDQGVNPMDSFVVAAHVLTSIGIHVPSAMEKVNKSK